MPNAPLSLADAPLDSTLAFHSLWSRPASHWHPTHSLCCTLLGWATSPWARSQFDFIFSRSYLLIPAVVLRQLWTLGKYLRAPSGGRDPELSKARAARITWYQLGTAAPDRTSQRSLSGHCFRFTPAEAQLVIDGGDFLCGAA